MSNATAVAPKGATKAPARKKAAPAPVAKKIAPDFDNWTHLNEGDRLAMVAVEILQTLVLSIIYDDHDKPRRLSINELFEVDHTLGRLLAPDCHDPSPGDPPEGDIFNHLALLASELKNVSELVSSPVRDIDIPAGARVFLAAAANQAFVLAGRILVAYTGLPSTLEDLRALTTFAGARPFRDKPQPPIRRTSAGLTPEQCDCVFEVVVGRIDTLKHLIMMVQRETGLSYDASVAIDAAFHIANGIGAMMDEPLNAKIIGDANHWNYGPNFSDAGKAGAA